MKSTVKKSHLNLSINPNLAQLFDDLSPVHGMTMSGFLEEKIIEMVEEYAPDYMMKLKIQETRELLSELEANLPSVEYQYKNLRQLKQNDSKTNSTKSKEADELEEYREKVYYGFVDAFTYQIDHGTFDWTRIIREFKFQTRFDAQEWVYARLAKDGITKK
ncbi:MAG: hypothetical protein PHW84_02050 [Methanosarcina sp.]|nr:hypothetical protein [Methanosarcina sp.]